jgi:aryl-alcohol dehydrogenase-like predicted oxidoreductase
MQAFADIVRAGKAHYIGVSEWTTDEIRSGVALAKDLGVQLISNQPQYSMLWRVIEQEIVPLSEELGIGQICWSPLAQGVLTGKYTPGAAPPHGSRFRGDNGELKNDHRFLNEDILTRVQELKPLAEETGVSMAAFAVAWVLQNPNVSAAIVGASRPEQLVDNVRAAGVKLDQEMLLRIDDILGPVIERDPGKVESFKHRP